MQHIFACFKEKGITDEELKTQFFDMTGKEDKRLSDTVLYNWKKGKHFPDLDKIFTIRCLLQKPVEELFIFEYSYVETEVPKKERGISGTKIFFITADRESDGIIKPKLWAFLLPEENLSIEELQAKYPDGRFFYFTTKARLSHSDISYPDNCYLLFGKETKGLPEELLLRNPENCVRIPMAGEIRSLNLSNSVAIGVYEVLRQWDYPALENKGELHNYRWDNDTII